MDISCNSNPGSGGTAGLWAGITLQANTRMAAITGNKSGCPAAPTYQKYGVQAVASADQYTVTANALENNASGGFGGTSGTASKVVGSNAQ